MSVEMHPHHLTNAELGLAELLSGGIFAAILHVAAHIPPVIGALIGTIVGGATLRLFDATLRAWGDRVKSRMPFTGPVAARDVAAPQTGVRVSRVPQHADEPVEHEIDDVDVDSTGSSH